MSRCMKNSLPPAVETAVSTAEKLKGSDIELPEAPDFVSMPPRVSLADAMVMMEELLPTIMARPGELERRLREKITVPFEL
jgi:hypothetical protein